MAENEKGLHAFYCNVLWGRDIARGLEDHVSILRSLMVKKFGVRSAVTLHDVPDGARRLFPARDASCITTHQQKVDVSPKPIST